MYDLEESFVLSSIREHELARPEPSSSTELIPTVMLTLASPQIQSSPFSLPFTVANFAEARSRAVELFCAVPELPDCTHSDISPPFECIACEKQLAECKAWYDRYPLELGKEISHSKFREDFGCYDSGEHDSGRLEVPVVRYPSCIGDLETVGEDCEQKSFLESSAKDKQYRHSRARGDGQTLRAFRPSKYLQLAKRLAARIQRLVTLKLR